MLGIRKEKRTSGMNPRISVIGLGYVGLTTAVAFAARGFRVFGCDLDADKVKRINEGKAPFFEPGLEGLLQDGLKKGFRASDSLHPSDIYFITVGTPSSQNGSIDLSQVEKAAHMLGAHLRIKEGYSLAVVKSTVTPGTTQRVVKPAIESSSGKRIGGEIGLVSNPEFLREGTAVADTLEPDAVFIGESDSQSGDSLMSFYSQFYEALSPIIVRTTLCNAELIKYANNLFLATKVSYMNMIANLCEKLPGADVEEVARGVGLDRRIGREYLRAGAGWGGSCWPKDLKALKASFSEYGVEAPILDATLEVNESQPLGLVRIARELIGDLKGKKVAVLGLSFKPETDDVREAVSFKVIENLLANGARVSAYDPVAMSNAKLILGKKITFASSSIEAMKEADCCMIVTEWSEFTKLEPEDFRLNMKSPVVVDGRRIYDPSKFSGLMYAAIGLNRAIGDSSPRG